MPAQKCDRYPQSDFRDAGQRTSIVDLRGHRDHRSSFKG